MNRNALSASEVLALWLETQIGNSHRVFPKGFDRVTSSGASADTRERAAAVVRSLPLYDICRCHLIEWCQGGLPELGLVELYLVGLEDHLRQVPFYPTTARDMENDVRLPVRWLSVDDAAKQLGVSRDCLRVRLDRLKVSLPFGSYKFERTWHVHPLDLERLRSK